jgi:hypothetical protein
MLKPCRKAVRTTRSMYQGPKSIATWREGSGGGREEGGASASFLNAPPTRSDRTNAYFFCKDSMYWLRFAMRCCTSLSWPCDIRKNNGPQTGMSLLP